MEEGNDGKNRADRNIRAASEGSDNDTVCSSFISGLIFVMSMIMIICTFPFSLCVCIRMVQVCLCRVYLNITVEYPEKQNYIVAICSRNMNGPSSLDWEN